MHKLFFEEQNRTPRIMFSPDENLFYIRGTSAPEDVRKLYYPVLEWFNLFVEEIKKGEVKIFNNENPLRFQFDLKYFNSSSAKFFFDFLVELKKLTLLRIPVNVEWYYEDSDQEMLEAGRDLSQLAEFEFTYISKPS